jgi:hypothetical protein
VNWDAVGAVAELLGALGVIATLGYLAFQIRQNTISMRSSSHQAAVTAVSDWSRAIGLDPTAAQLVQQGNLDLGALTPERRFQFMFLTTSLYRNFENIFYQHEQGAIDEAVGQGWSVRILGKLRVARNSRLVGALAIGLQRFVSRLPRGESARGGKHHEAFGRRSTGAVAYAPCGRVACDIEVSSRA